MAYRYGDRKQKMLFPQSIDEYVPSDAPVRAYDVFADALDLEALGIGVAPGKVGCPRYDPTVMLKLLLYGYSYVDELEKVDQQGIKVIVPSMKQAAGKTPGPFDKSHFDYDKETDSYTCPSGKTLTCRRTETDRGRNAYRPDTGVCPACTHFGQCTKSRSGRKVTRMLNEELRQKFEHQYEQPDSQDIYRLRKEKVELPFGHIKHNLKAGGFLLRGLPGVRAEMAILSSCFNIARMITLMGVSGLMAKLIG